MNGDVRFLTREIGSLAKPPWRSRSFAGRQLEEEDLEHAEVWGERLGVQGHEELLELLRRGRFGEDDLGSIEEWSARYAIALLEDAGLDVVYDGEQRRSEMYDHVVRHARGFEPRGTVRSFDNRYYSKSAVVADPSLDAPYDVAEYLLVSAYAGRRVKAPFTGAYTIADWTYDEHYGRGSRLGATEGERAEARRRFVLALAERVVRPNLAAVVEAGCDWVQLDEPALTTRANEVQLGVEAFNAVVAGLQVFCSLHVCYSDYRLLFPAVLELESCLEIQLELAGRDERGLGTSGTERPGYEALFLFRENGGPSVGVGVIDVHSDFVEPPELVRDRILYAAAVLGPERIYVNPDCGLRTRSWAVAHAKLVNMVQGTRLAEAALNGT